MNQFNNSMTKIFYTYRLYQPVLDLVLTQEVFYGVRSQSVLCPSL